MCRILYVQTFSDTMWIPNLPVTVLSAMAAVAGGVSLYKDTKSGPAFDRKARADNKTVIITGASTGIGKEAAWELANRGAKVFMACRDMKKCEQVRRDMVLETQNKYVYCRPCDLASFKSIAEFVARFKSEEPYVDILVNNAGVMGCEKSVTQDGIETQLGVNHMGHFLLTNLLLDSIPNSPDSRIVTLSCAGYKKGEINKEDLNRSNSYEPLDAYNQSKLANVLFAAELGRRLLDSKISVSVVDPGHTDSYLARHLPMSKSMTRYIIYPIFWPSMKTPRMGAQGILHAALDPKMDKCYGDYYVNFEKTETTELGRNYELAQWLWKVSEKWTRLEEYKRFVKDNTQSEAAAV